MSTSNIIRKPNSEDVEYLIANIRDEDMEEIKAMHTMPLRQILEETPDLMNQSQTWEVNGKLVCMFGVTRIDDNQGVIWMLATSEFDKYSKLFAVKCRKVVMGMVNKYKYVFNYVYSKNETSIKWLKWLGFNVLPAEPIGVNGAKFNRFEMINV